MLMKLFGASLLCLIHGVDSIPVQKDMGLAQTQMDDYLELEPTSFFAELDSGSGAYAELLAAGFKPWTDTERWTKEKTTRGRLVPVDDSEQHWDLKMV
jgi:hypothetical protein